MEDHQLNELHELFDGRYLTITISLLGATLAFTVSASQIAITATGLMITAAVAIWILGFTLFGALIGALAGVLIAFAIAVMTEGWQYELKTMAKPKARRRHKAVLANGPTPTAQPDFADTVAYGI